MEFYREICTQLILCTIEYRVTGGELFDEIVAREFYSESDARSVIHIFDIH